MSRPYVPFYVQARDPAQELVDAVFPETIPFLQVESPLSHGHTCILAQFWGLYLDDDHIRLKATKINGGSSGKWE